MFFPFKQRFKQYLNFSKKDRSAIIILAILMVIVFVAHILIDFLPVKSDFDYSEFEQALINWESTKINESETSQTLFEFNPNSISEVKLDSLLLPGFIKNNLLNYRKAGGKIKSAEDFRKIYGMNDSIFLAIKNYIKIQESFENRTKSVSEAKNRNNPVNEIISQPVIETPEKNMPFIIELNSTDSAELTKLKGIGPVFASRIMKYRRILGGYYSKNQLKEVYNFPEETFINIRDNISTDTLLITKLRINFSDYKELLRHPYFSNTQVNAIIKFRNENGPFQNKEQIITHELVDSTTFAQIEPYILCR